MRITFKSRITTTNDKKQDIVVFNLLVKITKYIG